MSRIDETVEDSEDAQILKRTDEPTTVYKKTDRDDVIDITDFEFLAQLLQRK